MPKRIPTLGAVAADEKKAKKARGLLSSLLALFDGGEPKAGAPDAKMTKRTLTTKRVEMEESDTDSGEEEEEEEMDSETDMSSTDKSDPGTESAAEEEEEEEEESSEEEGKRAKGAKYEEEEEEKALSRAVAKALKSSKVKAAFLAEIPEHLRPLAALRSPDRLFRELRRATGASTFDGAMTALSRLRTKAVKADEKSLRAQAELAAKVKRLEATQTERDVEALVQTAKAEGRASSKDLRAQLRAFGKANGAAKLGELIATLPKVPTNAKAPKLNADGTVPGAPNLDQQAMLKAMFGDLPEDQRKAAIADFETKMRMNGAGKAEA